MISAHMYSLSTALHHSASTAVVASACPAPAAMEEVEVRKCLLHTSSSSAETIPKREKEFPNSTNTRCLKIDKDGARVNKKCLNADEIHVAS